MRFPHGLFLLTIIAIPILFGLMLGMPISCYAADDVTRTRTQAGSAI